MLEVKNICVSINDKDVLKDFDLNIVKSEVHVIMGPNGIGKSTLSRVIMGDKSYVVKSGSLTFEGENILNKKTDEISRMGVFLAMQYPPEVDGVSNQDFLKSAMSAKMGKNIGLYDFILKCEKAAEELDMDKNLLHRSVNSGFSGGEKKKNEILQMKLLEPKLIILDELDSGLDIDSLKITTTNISRYQKESGASILIITHHPKILEYIKADYVHIMKDGRIVQTGDSSLANYIEKNGFNDNYPNEDDLYE